jgi:hypothetical protein
MDKSYGSLPSMFVEIEHLGSLFNSSIALGNGISMKDTHMHFIKFINMGLQCTPLIIVLAFKFKFIHKFITNGHDVFLLLIECIMPSIMTIFQKFLWT